MLWGVALLRFFGFLIAGETVPSDNSFDKGAYLSFVVDSIKKPTLIKVDIKASNLERGWRFLGEREQAHLVLQLARDVVIYIFPYVVPLCINCVLHTRCDCPPPPPPPVPPVSILREHSVNPAITGRRLDFSMTVTQQCSDDWLL